MSSQNTPNEDRLLVQLLTRGLESTDQIRSQMEDIKEAVGQMQLMVGVMQERTTGFKEVEKEVRILAERSAMADHRLDTTIDALQKNERNFNEQVEKVLKRMEASLQEHGGKTSKLEARVDALEKQQARWVGAMGVISVAVAFLMSLIKDLLK